MPSNQFITTRKNQNQNDKHADTERDHEAFALFHRVILIGNAASLRFFEIFLWIKIQTVASVVPYRAFYQSDKQQTIQ